VRGTSFYNLLRLGGACWIAVIDAPGKYYRNKASPEYPTLTLKVVGAVRWLLSGTVCVDEATVHVDNGVPKVGQEQDAQILR
jgi:hypothetical protein